MAQSPNDDLLKGRRESASLIGLDADNLSPADTLRCDLISTLRLVTDDAAVTVLDGSSADLGRLITATEGLIKLLPNRELPTVPPGPDDPPHRSTRVIEGKANPPAAPPAAPRNWDATDNGRAWQAWHDAGPTMN